MSLMGRNRARRSRATATIVAGLVALGAAALAAPASADHSLNGWHWAGTTGWNAASDFTIRLKSNVEPEWDPYLEQAAAVWSLDTEGNPLRLRVAEGSSKDA